MAWKPSMGSVTCLDCQKWECPEGHAYHRCSLGYKKTEWWLKAWRRFPDPPNVDAAFAEDCADFELRRNLVFCGAQKEDGKACRRKGSYSGSYCWQHRQVQGTHA